MEAEKQNFVNWVKKNKKSLIIAGISISALILLILGIKNKDAFLKLWKELQEKVKTANMYSAKWFESVSDTELEVEREKVRLAYCSSGENFSESCALERLLNRFDREMSKRAWGDEIPHAPSIHREHGWYLPNDD